MTNISWVDAKLGLMLIQMAAVVIVGILAHRKPSWLALPETLLRFRLWPAFAVYVLTILPLAGYFGEAIGASDESAYRFQASTFRAGRLTEPSPPPVGTGSRKFCYFKGLTCLDGKWISKYPPGWPAILAAWSFGAPSWLLSPTLGLGTLLLLYRFGTYLSGPEPAALAVYLCVASPFFVLNHIGFWSHGLSTFLVLLAAYYVYRSISSDRLQPFAVTLLSLSVLALVRPYTAALTGIIFCGYLLIRVGKSKILPSVSMILCAGLLTGGIWFVYNSVTTGSGILFGYAAYDRQVFPTDLSLTWKRFSRHLYWYTPRMVASTAISGFPLLLPVAVLAWLRGNHRWLAAPFAALIIAGLFGPQTSASPIGQRYYLEGYVPLTLMCALCFSTIFHKLGHETQQVERTPPPETTREPAPVQGGHPTGSVQMPDSSAYLRNGVLGLHDKKRCHSEVDERGRVFVFLLCCALLGLTWVFHIGYLWHIREPYRAFLEFVSRHKADGTLILMKRSPSFNPLDANPNEAPGPLQNPLYLPDVSPDLRQDLCRQFGKKEYLLAWYSEKEGRFMAGKKTRCDLAPP